MINAPFEWVTTYHSGPWVLLTNFYLAHMRNLTSDVLKYHSYILAQGLVWLVVMQLVFVESKYKF